MIKIEFSKSSLILWIGCSFFILWITEDMKVAAAKAIASIVKDDELNEEYIIPDAFNKEVAKAVADAVAECARKSGVTK